MNRTFQEVAATYKATAALTHAQVVTRLYRRSLKLLESWAIDRELFNTEATRIRARFDAHKTLDPRSGVTARIMREAAEEVAKWAHPDPYVVSYMPGGSRFMRNPALPLKAVFPEGIPAEANVAPQTVHYVQVPLSGTPKGPTTVLIDVYKKTAE